MFILKSEYAGSQRNIDQQDFRLSHWLCDASRSLIPSLPQTLPHNAHGPHRSSRTSTPPTSADHVFTNQLHVPESKDVKIEPTRTCDSLGTRGCMSILHLRLPMKGVCITCDSMSSLNYPLVVLSYKHTLCERVSPARKTSYIWGCIQPRDYMSIAHNALNRFVSRHKD